jgi:hypothetical protein
MHFSEDHDYIVVYARRADTWRLIEPLDDPAHTLFADIGDGFEASLRFGQRLGKYSTRMLFGAP